MMVPNTGIFSASFSHQTISSSRSAPISNQMSGKKIRWLFSTILFRKTIEMLDKYDWVQAMTIKLPDIFNRFNQQVNLHSSASRSRHARFLRNQTNRFLVSEFQEFAKNPHRFQIYAEFMQILLGLQPVHLIHVDRIA